MLDLAFQRLHFPVLPCAAPAGGRCPHGGRGHDHEAEQAEVIVASEQADAVMLAREMLRDPYWPLHAAKVLSAEGRWPRQYDRAR